MSTSQYLTEVRQSESKASQVASKQVQEVQKLSLPTQEFGVIH